MKTRDIRGHLQAKGYERGTLFVLESMQEQINRMEKHITEMEQMMMKMIDTMSNVVNGAVGMRDEMQKALAKHGVSIEALNDGQGDNTQGL